MRRVLSIAAIAAIAVLAFVPVASAATKTAVTFDGAILTNGASMWSGEVVSPKAKRAHKRASPSSNSALARTRRSARRRPSG